MPADAIHGNRLGKFTTPLGDDELLLMRFNGSEAMNELFEFDVEAQSTKSDHDFDAVLGSSCTLQFKTIYDTERYFAGICTEVQSHFADEGGYRFSLTLRPWLWLLSKRTNYKIFSEKTVKQIITEVFGDYGSAADFKFNPSKDYPVLEYTVQYGETDLEFVTRLLAHYGINFHFEHTKSTHTLVLTDSVSAYEPADGNGGSRMFYPDQHQTLRDEEHFGQWSPERRFTSGKVMTLDYDFKKPTADLKSETTGDAKFEHGKLEVFEYASKHVEKSVAKHYSDSRIDMLRSQDNRHFAAGNCLCIVAGSTVTLEGHPVKSWNGEYLAVGCQHNFVSESYASGSVSSNGESYTGSYEFLPANILLAPPKSLKYPSVRGPQTAKVVGEGEIDCDKHGRILVLFHWDREKTYSMRCRVAQVWAGKGWGGMVIPRVGMEVVVEFLEGDPDRPLVIGCVYNGTNTPPFELPGSKNIAGLKSNSTEGGGGYNELVFDDTKGNELFRQHAQFDMETLILNDERREVKVNQSTTIGNNQSLTVGKDRTGEIKDHDKLDVGKTITVEAGQKITLKVGGSSIVMDGMSITITSPTVEIKAGQQFKSSAGITSEHKAGAMMDIKGALVKINS